MVAVQGKVFTTAVNGSKLSKTIEEEEIKYCRVVIV